MAKKRITLEQLQEAKNKLASRGWTHVDTILQPPARYSKLYGIVYRKGNKKYYLNEETIDKLPEE